MISKLLKSLSEIGIDPSYDVFDKAAIRTANNFFLLALPVYIFFIILNIQRFSLLLIVTYTVLALMTSITLLLNYYKMHATASLYIIYVFLLQFCFLYIIFGPEIGIEPLFILLVFASIYLFYRKTGVYLIVLSIVLSYLAVRYYRPIYFGPTQFSVFKITPYIFFITSVVIMTQFAITQFRKIVQYAHSRDEAVHELQHINQSLLENESLILNQKNELEKINEQLERYAHIASHDLKSPIRSLKSFLDLAKIKLKQGDVKKVDEYFTFMSKSASHMNNLVNDLLAFSKLEDQNIVFEKTDLNKLLQSVIELLQAEKFVVHEDLPEANVNPTQFQMVFQNLIQNGLKYNDSNKPTVDIKYKNTEDTHVLTFTDNGLGIEDKYKEDIFKMFSRLHSGKQYEGTGLGLSICQKTMSQHKGQIILKKSEMGEGSTFEMSWPKEL